MHVVLADSLVLEPQLVGHADALFDALSDPALYAHEGAPPASLDACASPSRC